MKKLDWYNGEASLDCDASIKDSVFARQGWGVIVLCLYSAT